MADSRGTNSRESGQHVLWRLFRSHPVGIVCGLVPLVAWLVSLPYNFSISNSPFYDGEWSYLPLVLALRPLWPLMPRLLGFYRSCPTLCNILVAIAAALVYSLAGITLEFLYSCAKRAMLSALRAIRR